MRLRLVCEPDRLTVVDGQHTVLAYHHGAAAPRYPYCHPVSLPAGGPSVVLARPFDHDWHLGLYFSWKYLNGRNVWEGADHREPHGGTRPVDFAPIEAGERGVGLRNTIVWVTSEGEPLLRDRRTLLVRPPTDRASYTLDWTFAFEPPVDEVAFERKVEWGGYAGFSARLPRSFQKPAVLNAEGRRTTEETHAARSAWTDYSGWIDGQGRKAWGGLAMIDHPTNRRHPTPWLTFDRPALQFLNAAFLRDEPFRLGRGETLRLAYRAVVHWDVGDPDALEGASRAFGATDPHAEVAAY